jgi:hypothetical protein
MWYRNFTYKQLAKAVDKMSWWLEQKLGESVNLVILAYMGTSDLRYLFLYVAAIKTQRKVELNSSFLGASANQFARAISFIHKFQTISFEPSEFNKFAIH